LDITEKPSSEVVAWTEVYGADSEGMWGEWRYSSTQLPAQHEWPAMAPISN